ncbi:hypothetical protein GCM10023196_065420 [Actinoallomurus vinaceus]|uniref:Transposase n=1 Tax=Actinoallomurus vinaceus TaxID=1080074 RepID=A0ABP8UKP1_9ACTN
MRERPVSGSAMQRLLSDDSPALGPTAVKRYRRIGGEFQAERGPPLDAARDRNADRRRVDHRRRVTSRSPDRGYVDDVPAGATPPPATTGTRRIADDESRRLRSMKVRLEKSIFYR